MRSLMTPRSMSWFMRRIADRAERLETLRDPVDLLPEKLAQLDNSLVTDAKMLRGSIRQGTLGFPGHRILRRHHVQCGIRALRF